MRTVMTSGTLLLTFGLIVCIYCSVINTDIRQKEISNSLNSALEYTGDVLCDTYQNIDLSVENEHDCQEKLMQKFVDTFNLMINSDGEFTVKLIEFDIRKGVFHVFVQEEYKYPGNIKRKGVCSCERAYLLK